MFPPISSQLISSLALFALSLSSVQSCNVQSCHVQSPSYGLGKWFHISVPAGCLFVNLIAVIMFELEYNCLLQQHWVYCNATLYQSCGSGYSVWSITCNLLTAEGKPILGLKVAEVMQLQYAHQTVMVDQVYWGPQSHLCELDENLQIKTKLF